MLGEHVEVDVVGVLNEQTLKVLHELVELRPVVGLPGPAVGHDVVELPVAVRGLLQAATVAHELHHLGGGLAGVRGGTCNVGIGVTRVLGQESVNLRAFR